ncbi:MAG: class I SAM-dependent methyltransferase [Armatimonadota bacterium]|nr:class I SAM-dependent methyltransferase [Armatimonadota bacterium]MDR7439888.1 class I SAM-dependent methyltransferase [Armatimonadota bacterium]MDR7563317.1 class I SAM-dependent methyltransferase [Armatimonadota bacterium]MDR7601980.1 class I SAM-dependent methyltransferase [Armatimonadota bacterium]
MREHYFAPTPTVRSRPREVRLRFGDRLFVFETDRGVFSHGAVDRGTRLLLEALEVRPEDEILDVGCGYGVIGLVAAAQASRGRAVLVDINERAVALARGNALRNGIRNVEVLWGDLYEPVGDRAFDLIVTNPPIRAGRAVVRALIEGARAHLRPGGRFYLVARTAQGARTLGRIIGEVFGNVAEVERGGGYRVYRAVREDGGV